MEHEFIHWLKETFHCEETFHHDAAADKVVCGIGDDAAIVDCRDGLTVISTDMIADGIHFVLGQTPDELIGRKALAVNLSDLAAMAAVPHSAVVSVMFPRDLPMKRAQAIFLGLKDLADQFSIAIVGGDTNRWDGPLVINCAVTGQVPASRATDGQWRMNAATVGDVILVSGSFGNSISGKHLQFEPRVELANYLAANYEVHAATDITDSLSIDLAAICRQSGCGFQMVAQDIPLSAAAQALGGDDKPLQAALHDGEDFELAITVAADVADAILADKGCPVLMTRIGSVIKEQVFEIAMPDGSIAVIEPKGYEH